MLSAGLTSHFSIKKSENYTGFVAQFFQVFTGLVILTACWSFVDAGHLWLLSMYYLLCTHVEYRDLLFYFKKSADAS